MAVSSRRAVEPLTISIRPAVPSDAPFLFALYRSVREHKFAFLPPVQLERILHMQFEAQLRDYAAQYPNAEDWIILFDGEPAGRLLWCEQAGESCVVDIAVVAQLRNRGIGTYALEAAIRRAKQLGKPLRLAVRQGNDAAIRLYRRLGFIILRKNELFLEMEHRGTGR
jgi:ribosomal protein S18 acetylase RimI-like enzyme